MDDPIKNQSQDDAVPDALRDELARVYSPGEPIEVPPEIDQSIAQMARWRLSERVAATAGKPRGLSWAKSDSGDKRRIFPMRLVTISAAAAALLLVVLVAPRLMKQPTKSGTVAQGPVGRTIALPGDIDADGRVDIVDALVLSKLVAKDPTVAGHLSDKQSNLDFNADGVVDQQDAVAVRAMVVKLEGSAG
jgi:hypothetical protein